MKNHIGSTLESLFEELGELDEVIKIAQGKTRATVLATEIDFIMKLHLSFAQWSSLVFFIDGYSDRQKIAKDLMTETPKNIFRILRTVKK